MNPNIADFEINFSITAQNQADQNSAFGWQCTKAKNLNELCDLVKNYSYSSAFFKNSHRKGENVIGFGNLLIFDIDNDKNSPQFSINEALKLFENHAIQTLIIPTKSHQILKNEHIADRFRILIPTQTPPNPTNKDEFKEFQNLCAKVLKISEFTDKSAQNDPARYYAKSPAQAIGLRTQGRIMDISAIQARVKEILKAKEQAKQIQISKIQEIKQNTQKYKNPPQNLQQGNFLSYLDSENFKKMLEFDIAQIAQALENPKIYTDSYKMLKTPNAKYALIESENLLHDFKNNKTYNVFTYIKEIKNLRNVNDVAREFEKITGQKVLSVNMNLVNQNIKSAVAEAKNIFEFEESLKKAFNVKFVKFSNKNDKERYLQIADMKISESCGVDLKSIADRIKV